MSSIFESDSFRSVWAPRLLSVVRIFLGLLYLQHGLSKYFGFPAASPANFQMFSLIGLAGAIEIVGSVLLILGFYTRWTAFIISGEMAVAFLIVRNRLSVSLFPTVNGGQLAILFCFVFLFLTFAGGGVWSADEQLARSRAR